MKSRQSTVDRLLYNTLMELLSPAGGFESLKAAVENGADAVYIGAQNFSARNLAENFENIAQAVSYAHASDVKLYLALNTLVRDREIPSWLATAKEAARAGVDAFIVQDLGGASLLKQFYPDVPLHASTQMTAYSTEGVRALTELGFSRVILARELSFDEICNIRRQTGTQLEIFVHGALCVCYSGQCLMSSIFGGRSANRGLCAQPCRLDYRLEKKSGRLLSPKDLCLVDYIGEIEKAGIASIKIEGRMKPAQYVGTVTRVYRKALDTRIVTQKDKDDLLKAFSRRGFTTQPFSAKMPPAPIVQEQAIQPASPSCTAAACAVVPHSRLLAAQVTGKKQALAVLKDVDIVYVPVSASWAAEVAMEAHNLKKQCIGVHPLIDHRPSSPAQASFDGEMLATLLDSTVQRKIADLSFNVMNSDTLRTLRGLGYERATLSAELNLAQIRDLCKNKILPTEAIVYGRLPLMTTIHCPFQCDKKRCRVDDTAFLTDRMGKSFPIVRAGSACCISILNSLPLFMADKLDQVSADVLRLKFTTESPAQCASIAQQYRRAMQGHPAKPMGDFTRGHFLRGVK